MNDLFERLRAANPVEDCAEPSIEAVLAALPRHGHDRPRTNRRGSHGSSRTRNRRRLALSAALVAAVAALGVAVVGHSGGGLSLVSRAYAATDPRGGIIHYTMTSRLVTEPGERAAYVDFRSQVWRSATRSRTVGETSIHEADGRVSVTHSEDATELVPGGERLRYYDPRTNTLFGGLQHIERAAPGVCDSLQACTFAADPLAALHRLYRSGHLHQEGPRRMLGEQLDVLSEQLAARAVGKGSPPHTTVFLNPSTGDPVRIVVHFGANPPNGTTTSVFHEFERLPLTAANKALLVMRPHPHARQG